MRRARTRAGFTLLELIVVVAILTVLAGMALPAASRVHDRAARRATSAELERLAEATLAYAEDTLQLPRELDDLVERPSPAVAGWSGPYLPFAARGATRDARPGWALDGWSRPYALEPLEHGVRLRSTGRDGTVDEGRGAAGADDLWITVDLRPVLRERTLATLRTVNRAVELYYAGGGAEAHGPLPAEPASALAKLVAAGCLPEVQAFRTDAWGVELVADPVGRSPLVRFASSSLGADRPAKARRSGLDRAPGRAPWSPPRSSGRSGLRRPPAEPEPGEISEAWRRLERRALRDG